MTKDQVPEGCTCGEKELCPLHFVAEDFFPGALVRVNPYSEAKYGKDPRFVDGAIYRVTEVRPNVPYPGHINIALDNGSCAHHGYFLPDHFLSQARKAIRESENANP